MRDLWQAHNQVLSIIFLNEFIKLNAKMFMLLKKMKHVELNTKIASVVLNKQIVELTKVTLILREGECSYECMGDWKKEYF